MSAPARVWRPTSWLAAALGLVLAAAAWGGLAAIRAGGRWD